MFKSTLILIFTLLLAMPVKAEQAPLLAHRQAGVLLEQLADGLGVPWGMSLLSNEQLIFSERDGKLGLLDLKTLKLTRLGGVPRVAAIGQGGMLDVAAAPDYARSGWIYFTYSKPVDGNGATTLARARLKQQRLVDWEDLLVSDSATDTGYHFGSRIAFDDDGHVFFGVGDRGMRDPAQDLSNHIGAIIRLNLDGSIPDDNPFVGHPGARAEIWSYGHRNPQGLVYDSVASRLWEIEHGPRGGDEINLIEAARNYGWPVISHGKEYWGPVSIGEGTSKAGMEQPVKVYIPSIAPGSLIIYHGDAFPHWRGNLFTGALKLRHLNRVILSPRGEAIGEERLFEELNERIRALALDDRGWIYLSTDSGRILRMRPRP